MLLEAANVLVDESLLTCESAPVRKRMAAPGDTPAPPGDDVPIVYSGTLVVAGGAGVAASLAARRLLQATR